jgi:hypothetical protein
LGKGCASTKQKTNDGTETRPIHHLSSTFFVPSPSKFVKNRQSCTLLRRFNGAVVEDGKDKILEVQNNFLTRRGRPVTSVLLIRNSDKETQTTDELETSAQND